MDRTAALMPEFVVKDLPLGRTLMMMMMILYIYINEAGLTMNITKTKVMTNSEEIPIWIGQAHLDYVHQYVYLGQTISLHASTETEVKQRIGIAWTKFWF